MALDPISPAGKPSPPNTQELKTAVERTPNVDVSNVDVEKVQTSTSSQDSSNNAADDDDAGYKDNSAVPRLSLPYLFWFFFYNFGLFAWGGPVAQIALIKDRLVLQDKWITLARF